MNKRSLKFILEEISQSSENPEKTAEAFAELWQRIHGKLILLANFVCRNGQIKEVNQIVRDIVSETFLEISANPLAYLSYEEVNWLILDDVSFEKEFIRWARNLVWKNFRHFERKYYGRNSEVITCSNNEFEEKGWDYNTENFEDDFLYLLSENTTITNFLTGEIQKLSKVDRAILDLALKYWKRNTRTEELDIMVALLIEEIGNQYTNRQRALRYIRAREIKIFNKLKKRLVKSGLLDNYTEMH